MKKTARRTDITIIVVLALLAVFIVLSIGPWNKPASTQSDPLPLESYNGKPLGVIPGGLSEAVTEQRFPDSPYVYYTGLSELYTALSSRKIDGFVGGLINGGTVGGLIGLTGGAGGAVIGAVVGGVTGAIVGAFD